MEGIPKEIPPRAIDDYYQLSEVRDRFADAEDPDGKRTELIAAASIWMRASDAQYANFLVSLGLDRKTADLLLEVGAAAAGSIGAISGSSANEWSAATAGFTGSRAAIDRNLFYDKTLPGIIGAMEVNRLRVKTRIWNHLLNDNVGLYPPERAWADIEEYRLAEGLDQAVSTMVATTNQAVEAQTRQFESATESCSPTSDVTPYWRRLNHYVYGLASAAGSGAVAEGSDKAKAREKLAQVASLVNGTTQTASTTAEEAKAQAKAVLAGIGTFCSKTKAEGFLNQISAKTGDPIP